MAAVLNYPAVSISDILSRFEEEVTKTPSRDALVKLFCSQIIPFISNHPILEPLRSRWSITTRAARSRLKKMVEEGVIHRIASSEKDPKATLILSKRA